METQKNQLLLDTQVWLTSMKNNNTRRAYEKHVNDFCQYLFNDKLNNINEKLIENFHIDYDTIVKYKNYLSDTLGYQGQTLRTKFFGTKSWLVHLYKLNKYDIDNPSALSLDKKTLPKVKGNNGSKPYTHNEILQMIEKAKTYQNGEMKSLLIEFAYTTAWRKEAILKGFTYGDMYKIKDNCDYWLCDIVDKGDKEDTKPISDDLYQRLCSLNPNHEEDDLVFKISDTAVDNLIKQLNKDLNIKGNKSFHGIKKASVNRVLDLTSDLLKAQKHGCHESLETTAKFYLKYNQDYEDAMSLHIMDKLDTSIFVDMTKEELLKIILASEDKTKFSLLTTMRKIKK